MPDTLTPVKVTRSKRTVQIDESVVVEVEAFQDRYEDTHGVRPTLTAALASAIRAGVKVQDKALNAYREFLQTEI
jgi:predicted RNA-binding Zn ribbon-like protein